VFPLVRVRREKSEIYICILESALNGAKKTHIMHRANLNHSLVSKYLDELLALGLIEVLDDDGDVVYRTTVKGVETINLSKRFRESLGKFHF